MSDDGNNRTVRIETRFVIVSITGNNDELDVMVKEAERLMDKYIRSD